MFYGEGPGDFCEGAVAVGPEEGPGRELCLSNLSGDGSRRVFEGGGEEGGAAGDAAGAGEASFPRRPFSGADLPHPAFAFGQVGEGFRPSVTLHPALQAFEGGVVAVAEGCGLVRRGGLLKLLECPIGLGRGQVDDLPAAGIGKIGEVAGHRNGGGGQAARAQFGQGVGRAVVGGPHLPFFAIVRGESGTGEAVVGVAQEGVGGGDEGAMDKPVAGVGQAKRCAQYRGADPVYEPGRHRNGGAPGELATADRRPGADRVDADAGQGGTIALHIFGVVEEAVTFVGIQQPDATAGAGEAAVCDEAFDQARDLQAEGNAGGVVVGARFVAVGENPEFVPGVVPPGEDAADQVVGTDVLANVDPGAEGEVAVLLSQPSELFATGFGEDQTDEPNRGVFDRDAAPPELALVGGAGIVGYRPVGDDAGRTPVGKGFELSPQVHTGEDCFSGEPTGGNAVEFFRTVQDDQFGHHAVRGGAGASLDGVPGVFLIVQNALPDRPEEIAGGGADVGGLVDDPPSRPDPAAGRDGGDLCLCPGGAVAPDEGPRGVVKPVEGVPAVGLYNAGNIVEDALSVRGFPEEGKHGPAEFRQGAGGTIGHTVSPESGIGCG